MLLGIWSLENGFHWEAKRLRAAFSLLQVKGLPYFQWLCCWGPWHFAGILKHINVSRNLWTINQCDISGSKMHVMITISEDRFLLSEEEDDDLFKEFDVDLEFEPTENPAAAQPAQYSPGPDLDGKYCLHCSMS